VNLDLAQATDSGLLQAAKRANRYSLASQGTYETAGKLNTAALEDWANAEAERYSPQTAGHDEVGSQVQDALRDHINSTQSEAASSEAAKYSPESESKEVVGQKLQQALLTDLDGKQNAATTLYNQLDQNVGAGKPDASSVYAKAREIIADNADYYDKNPALKQSRAWQIVNDLAKRGETAPEVPPAATPEGFETFNPDTPKVAKPVPEPDSWTDLQKLRTDLMSEYRSKEIVGTRAEGWLKQLTGTVDAGSGLKGEDLSTFREANSIHQGIKSVYDDPQSPVYHAVRAQFPSKVPDLLSQSTPELARNVRAILKNVGQGDEGRFQRQFVETLLNGKDGATPDLGGLNARLRTVRQAHLTSMLGEDGADALRQLGKEHAQNPFTNALKQQFPSQVPDILSGGSPELAQATRNVLGDLEGPFQRDFVERQLRGKDGVTLDFAGLNNRLKAIPQARLEAMLGEEGASSLRMLGKVAEKITADINPSGTAKVGIPASEALGLYTHTIPTALELGTQYGGAKLMNSQRLLNYLTTPKD